MRKFTAVVICILFAMFSLGAYAGESESESYQDRYIIAQQTYDTMTSDAYRVAYYKVRRIDLSAARTMRHAARDMCENVYGGDFQEDFSCKSVPNR